MLENDVFRNMFLMAVIALILACTVNSFASTDEVINSIINKTKIGTYCDDGEWDLIVGYTIKENIGKMPVDLAVYSDGDEAVLLGLDVNINPTKNTSLGIGVVYGVDRIETMLDLGETIYGPMLNGRVKVSF